MLSVKNVIFFSFILFLTNGFAFNVPIYDFSLKAYSQKIHDYLPKKSEDYQAPLLTKAYQKKQLLKLYNKYYASGSNSQSPWGRELVELTLPMVEDIERQTLTQFDNQGKDRIDRHYAENFKVHRKSWFNNIAKNMDLALLKMQSFKESNRAIAINNTYARALPELSPDFNHPSLAGQGFPFDNLQVSSVWAGTPLYVISVSLDKSWSLVITPDLYFAWVKSDDIAYVSNQFIEQWQTAAKQGLIAITKTKVSIFDEDKNFKLTSYIGSLFPLKSKDESDFSILIPVRKHKMAVIEVGTISAASSALMPLVASKKNITNILKELQNRPYGWGGNFFFNDCSQELKSLFTPLGIWLPRNSSKQAELRSVVNLSEYNVEERINILKAKGHPLMTIIYINGHVMLYVGNKALKKHQTEVITYQNVWGLSPESRDKRYVIGQSLFLPLVNYFPEAPDAISQAGRSQFKLIYLDDL